MLTLLFSLLYLLLAPVIETGASEYSYNSYTLPNPAHVVAACAHFAAGDAAIQAQCGGVLMDVIAYTEMFPALDIVCQVTTDGSYLLSDGTYRAIVSAHCAFNMGGKYESGYRTCVLTGEWRSTGAAECYKGLP